MAVIITLLWCTVYVVCFLFFLLLLLLGCGDKNLELDRLRQPRTYLVLLLLSCYASKVFCHKSRMKFLLSGDVNGKFSVLQKRISKLNKSKHGPFDAVLCVGNFFNNANFQETAGVAPDVEKYIDQLSGLEALLTLLVVDDFSGMFSPLIVNWLERRYAKMSPSRDCCIHCWQHHCCILVSECFIERCEFSYRPKG